MISSRGWIGDVARIMLEVGAAVGTGSARGGIRIAHVMRTRWSRRFTNMIHGFELLYLSNAMACGIGTYFIGQIQPESCSTCFI